MGGASVAVGCLVGVDLGNTVDVGVREGSWEGVGVMGRAVDMGGIGLITAVLREESISLDNVGNCDVVVQPARARDITIIKNGWCEIKSR